MNNNQLIERKENIFAKIKNFFKNLFFKKNRKEVFNTVTQNIEETREPKSTSKKYETDKKEFFELYENSKKGEIDLLSLPPETLKKMCALLEEEIKMKEKSNELKREKLNAY